MTMLELRAELLEIDTLESVSIAQSLAELPPYFTPETLRRMNAAYARADRLMGVTSGVPERVVGSSFTAV